MHRALASPNPEQLAELRNAGQLFARYPEIAVVYVFGSYARGDARPDSDLDLGLVYRSGQETRAPHERLSVGLARDVAKLTGVERVDIVDLEPQGSIFCHRVLCEGSPIFIADEARRVDFESDTLTRAFDFRPTYELATAGKAAALRRWLKEHHDVRTDSVEARRLEGECR